MADLSRDTLQGDPQSPDAQADAAHLARAALARDPTTVSAAATLGLLAELRGDLRNARRDFRYAEWLSRRDLPTELWLLEDAVRRADVRGALRHYDIALRTQAGADEILFPVLASASLDPNVAQDLATTLRMGPPWRDEFFTFLANNTSKPPVTADFFEMLGRDHVHIADDARATLIVRLIAAQEQEVAWRYYATIRAGTDRRYSRDPIFTTELTMPTPFDWIAATDAGIAVTIQRGAASGAATFSAVPSVGGPLLRQLQLLPPGRYRIDGTSEGIEQAEAETPYWLLQCVGDGRDLGRVTVPNSAKNGGRFHGEFQVDTGCLVQSLELVARPSSALGGLSGAITRVALSPVGRGSGPERGRQR